MKAELRREMRRRLSAPRGEIILPVGEDEPFIPKGTKTLFAYLAHSGEIDAAALIDDAIARGISVAAPSVVSEGHLEFRAIGGSQGPFKTGAYGIREPLETAPKLWPGALGPEAFPVVILVPALAFSRSGDRLGRGAGYYDRFLTQFLAENAVERRRILLIGACHSFQIVETVPVESHDIPVDCILTEKGCIVCS
ncbi:MAG TPA: 5-formyltetrahydrofolate cyclo-ligase [Treponemataceae bacterium]|nr:5-formyltetrahydrofolate cyclo-ligase [Treponemataceae bacterium]